MKKISNRRKKILIYNVWAFISATIFASLIPPILNYPPGSVNTAFERTIDMGLNYWMQATFIILLAVILSNVYLHKQLKKVDKYKNYLGKDDDDSKQKIEKIKKQCFFLPYRIYFVHAIATTIAMIIIMGLTGTSASLTTSIGIMCVALFLMLAVLSYIFSRDMLNEVLEKLNNNQKYEGKIKASFARKIIFFFFPITLVAILFSSSITLTILRREKGDYIFGYYQNQFNLASEKRADTSQPINSVEDMKNFLHSVEKYSVDDRCFIISKKAPGVPNTEFDYREKDDTFTDEAFNDFFIKYTFNEAKNNRTYGYYATYVQGYYLTKTIEGTEYAYGIYFKTDSSQNYMVFLYGALILGICFLFLRYYAKDIGEQISVVSTNMMKIGNGETIDYDKKMTVVSNDELGDLVIAFNKILEIEKNHNLQMRKNQEILVEQERLSSLGQLIGGIAHNLKTPIMSISGASEGIRKLAQEYDMSIGNPQITDEDYHEITKEMNEWIDKIDDYLEYMTEIINAAKGQAVSMNASTVDSFSIEELIMRVQILMKEQLMHREIELDLKYQDIDKTTAIAGELSALVQVLNNLVTNAIEAYNNRPGKINLTIRDDENKIYIEVEDFAGGIAESVRDKLFNQMITTKGKDGTGLGLYMCYSTIKGKFNGNLSFETNDLGTKFLVELNKNK